MFTVCEELKSAFVNTLCPTWHKLSVGMRMTTLVYFMCSEWQTVPLSLCVCVCRCCLLWTRLYCSTRVCVRAFYRTPSLLRTSSHTTTVETSTPLSSIMTHLRYTHKNTAWSCSMHHVSMCVYACMWCIRVVMNLKFEQQQVPSDGWPIILQVTLQHA